MSLPAARISRRTKEGLILLAIQESRSGVGDPASSCVNGLQQSRWIPAFAGMTKQGFDQTFPKRPHLYTL
jgi:hypothetical protein